MRSEWLQAVQRVGLSLLVVDLDDLTIRTASRSALAALGAPESDVVGRPFLELLDEHGSSQVRSALLAMAAGAIDFYRSGREVDGSGGLRTEWVRATTFGDVRAALIEFATGAVVESPLAAYFGGEPDPIVVGTLDERLAVTAVSNEVERLLGRRPEDLIGVQIVEDHDAEAVNDLLDGIAGDDLPTVARLVHVADARGEPHRLCLMIVPSVGTKRCFLLVDDPELPSAAPGGEAARLEQVLRNIATELSNSGLLRDIQPSVVPVLPETQGLSRRQWEILSRLVRGERVPSIATELYVSQSTVRNHLTVIFRRFGVHSQAELLARLRDAATPG